MSIFSLKLLSVFWRENSKFGYAKNPKTSFILGAKIHIYNLTSFLKICFLDQKLGFFSVCLEAEKVEVL